MEELFGTDGVRGVANSELTGKLAYKIGRAGGYILTKNYTKKEKPKLLIGKDTRVSGDMLEAALVAGITSAGIDVIKLGITPTPGVAFLTGKQEVEGSVMISASHNPVADNGIKFFDKNGYKLSDQTEMEIENLINDELQGVPHPTHTDVGEIVEKPELKNIYIDHLLNSVQGDFSDFQVVLDCANGAAYQIAPQILKTMGVELKVINDQAEGKKINLNSGSTYPDVIKEKVQEEMADFGIAHDGDADRVILVDEKGNIVDGDKIMALLAVNFKEKGNLKKNTLVTTPYSNLGFKEYLNEKGIEVKITKNGDKYVLQEMLNNGYNLGGEKSGHIICLDHNYTGDGILTAIQILQVLEEKSKSLNTLIAGISEWPQKMINIEVKCKEKLEENDQINKLVNEAESDLGDEGRVYIRPSGTEPVIRLMLEGKDEDQLVYWEKQLKELISSELN